MKLATSIVTGMQFRPRPKRHGARYGLWARSQSLQSLKTKVANLARWRTSRLPCDSRLKGLIMTLLQKATVDFESLCEFQVTAGVVKSMAFQSMIGSAYLLTRFAPLKEQSETAGSPGVASGIFAI